MDQGEVSPHIVGLRSEGVKPRSIALADDLIEMSRPFDIGKLPSGTKNMPYIIKILTGIKRIPEFLA